MVPMRRSFVLGWLAFACCSVALVACGAPRSSSESARDSASQDATAPLEDASTPRQPPLAIVLIDVAGDRLCSGTLIAPRLVVTADDCVPDEDAPEAPSLGDASQTVALLRTAPADLAILVGDGAVSARLVAYGTHLFVPRFRPRSGFFAIVVLDEALTTVTPLRAGPAPHAGDAVRIGAFGLPRDGDPLGAKRIQDPLRIDRVSPSNFTVDGRPTVATLGAPVLDATTFALLGVATCGPRECDDPAARFARVDAYAWLIEAASAHVARLESR